jgi:type I restriction enzyme M protein
MNKNTKLDISTMESWLWDAACAIRGAQDAPKFKDFILPLIFYKRLSDVFDDEFAQQIRHFGDEAVAREVVEADHADALKNDRAPMVRFYIPADYSWAEIRNHGIDGLGEFITSALREVGKLNPRLQGVVDVKDYNERQSGQRTIEDDRLAKLVEVVSRHRLGLQDAEADILGRAYEYLLRKFAEGQGQSAGEFFTPLEVGWLMARILDPRPRTTAYDPTCGSGGLLIKLRILFELKHPDQRTQTLQLYGQEMNPVTYAIAKMNMFLHDFMDAWFEIGDTFTKPGFAALGAKALKKFDYAVANPMWNQDNYSESFYSNDPYNRFTDVPPNSSADWGWVQHIWASLNDSGKAAIVLDTGAVSRGSGSKNANKEKEARKRFVENDWIEGVVLLPDNLFYNTTAPGILLFLNKNKAKERKGQIILINASSFFDKQKPKNVLRMDEAIAPVVEAYHSWKSIEKLSTVISLKQAQEADYNLSPSQFINTGETTTHRTLADIMVDLATAHEAREKADIELAKLLNGLKLSL